VTEADQWLDDNVQLLQWPIFFAFWFGVNAGLGWLKDQGPLRCRAWGHRFRKSTTGMTEVNGWPVFQCRRCHRQWIPEHDHWSSIVAPTKRDHFERFQLGELPRGS
jgi:hypothetical protein